MECQTRSAEGELVWSDVILAPEFDPDGEVGSVLFIGADITHRKKARHDIAMRKQMEREREANLRFFQSMDRVNQIILQAAYPKDMFKDVLDLVLSVFDCDRAFLAYPCDPDADAWFVPMERYKPEYPGVFAQGAKVPMHPVTAESFRVLLNTDEPVKSGPGCRYVIPKDFSDRFSIKSFLSMALFPKLGKPWRFGVQQCSYNRQWNPEDVRLFKEIGRRLADGLTNMLTLKALRENEERLRSTLEAAQTVVWEVNHITGEHLQFGPVERLFGNKEIFNHLSLENLAASIHAGDRNRVIKKLVDGMDGKQDYKVEYRVPTADGDVRWIGAQGKLESDAQGNPVRMLGIAMDITEGKRADEALRNSEEKYRMVVENSMAGVYIIQDGYFRFVNKKWCEAQGYEYEEVVDKIPVLELVHPDSLDRFLDMTRKRIDGEIGPQTYELKTLRKDGGTLVWKITADVTQFRGRPAISGTAIDISREKELESMLLQSQKLEAIGTLAGGIAHDFNNILSILMGHTELARLADDENERNHHYQRVLNSCERAKNLIDQILSISRKREAERELVDVTLMVKEVVKFLRSTLPATIDMHRFVPPSSMVVSADPVWIHQILMNLCTNAAHAMKGHTGAIRVCLEGVNLPDLDFPVPNLPPGPYVRLQVSDTGCGIAPDIRDRIFDPFFSTKAVGEGTGLGLSVVYGLVKTMGGEISLESEPGKGSTFTAHIPHIVSAAVTQETEDRPTPLPGGRERLLLVDDEKAILEMYQVTFRRLGYDVVAIGNSTAALELFIDAPDRFDAVITDFTMPKMTGMEMAEKMRAMRPGLPILLNSGYGDCVEEESASKIGIRKLFRKPVPLRELARGLREVLDAPESVETMGNEALFLTERKDP